MNFKTFCNFLPKIAKKKYPDVLEDKATLILL